MMKENIKESFNLVMAVEAQKKQQADLKAKKEPSLYDSRSVIIVGVKDLNRTFHTTTVLKLDNEDLDYLYKKYKGILKDHLLKKL